MENRNPYVDMVIDAMDDDLSEDQNLDEDPNPPASKFYTLLRDADEPLWDGCHKHTKLSPISQLLNLKSEFNMSESCYDRMIVIIKSMLPETEKLPENFYRSKKMVNELGLGYEKIDACPNHCMLYDRENKDPKVCSACLVCRHPRFKPKAGCSVKEKDVPFSVLRYFPIIPRLQRLYMSKSTAQYMCWHADGVRHDKSLITHPADAEAWKHFDATYPMFAQEVRNVRLGLSTDGFSPFGVSAAKYTCWPVFVTPYNLLPSMCMRREYIFLSLMILGPTSPGKSLDVYLRPLIDELKILWQDGVNTFDAWKRQKFNMKATLLWTISDFPAYGMLSGWSTHGRLACPYCMRKSKSFRLKHGSKFCWFDCHRRFLPLEHPFRRDRYSFRKSKMEKSLPLHRRSGVEILNRVNRLDNFSFGLTSHDKRQAGFGKKHNWVKRSIFWELPYWSTNLIRHNLDVMHVEKNVFDNVFNTVMDIKGKTKDNANARIDMKKICKRPTLELIVENDKYKKPKATYVLNYNQRKMVCGWVKQLKFPDGYVSNIARRINVEEGKINGMKSHDCHVFMERLIPLAFRDMLPKPIWRALTELSLFFKEICANELRVSDMENAELAIIEIVCKLEKIFPPSFFDVMEHLLVHLPYEAKVGGPVQYRWMYPFERCILYLKRKARNKARVEGSICEAYILEEISNYVSKYIDPKLQTRRTKVPRNDDGGHGMVDECLSIFKYPYRPIGKGRNRFLTNEELQIAETYVLVNCKEVEPFLQ